MQRLPRKVRIAKWVGYFALIDLLFLPYFQSIILPISLPVILLVMLWLRIEIKRDHYFNMYLILCLFSMLSVFYSLYLSYSLRDFVIPN